MPSSILLHHHNSKLTYGPNYIIMQESWYQSPKKSPPCLIPTKPAYLLIIFSSTTTTTTIVLRPFVWDYPGELVPEETLTHPPSWSSKLLQSFCTTSFHVLFGLLLGLEPSTSYSIHFFTQSVSSFRSTCPYHHRKLFCCSINIISSIPSLPLNSLLGTLSFTNITHPYDHSYLCSTVLSISTCFAVVSILYHLFLVFLSTR